MSVRRCRAHEARAPRPTETEVFAKRVAKIAALAMGFAITHCGPGEATSLRVEIDTDVREDALYAVVLQVTDENDPARVRFERRFALRTGGGSYELPGSFLLTPPGGFGAQGDRPFRVRAGAVLRSADGAPAFYDEAIVRFREARALRVALHLASGCTPGPGAPRCERETVCSEQGRCAPLRRETPDAMPPDAAMADTMPDAMPEASSGGPDAARACDFLAQNCGEGATCVGRVQGMNTTFVCLRAGTRRMGEPCDERRVDPSECASGLLCASGSGRASCSAPCDRSPSMPARACPEMWSCREAGLQGTNLGVCRP